jgi:hypothetical protein
MKFDHVFSLCTSRIRDLVPSELRKFIMVRLLISRTDEEVDEKIKQVKSIRNIIRIIQ